MNRRRLGAAYSLFAIVFYMFYLSTMLSAIAKFAVPLMGIDEVAGLDLKYVLIPGLAGIVIVYGVLGGLTAAYWTDLIQGIFIILLSVLLIPFGLWALVKNFGDPSTQGFMDGFTIMHERVPGDFFQSVYRSGGRRVSAAIHYFANHSGAGRDCGSAALHRHRRRFGQK